MAGFNTDWQITFNTQGYAKAVIGENDLLDDLTKYLMELGFEVFRDTDRVLILKNYSPKALVAAVCRFNGGLPAEGFWQTEDRDDMTARGS